ncbi:hypothetical protein RHGRI_031001 [Rhododendron griersonianum]|nr:hypothetical protein RHGRI_031001 [Rhododendron griersonianum]
MVDVETASRLNLARTWDVLTAVLLTHEAKSPPEGGFQYRLTFGTVRISNDLHFGFWAKVWPLLYEDSSKSSFFSSFGLVFFCYTH